MNMLMQFGSIFILKVLHRIQASLVPFFSKYEWLPPSPCFTVHLLMLGYFIPGIKGE